MFITKKHLSRRTFMRGALGATVALPFLDAMIPALSAAPQVAVPVRRGLLPVRRVARLPGIPMRRGATSSSSR